MALAPEDVTPSSLGARDALSVALTGWEARDCPICESRGRPRLLWDATVDATRLDSFAFASRKIPETMHLRLVRCDRCDLVYADPVPSHDSLHRAYLDAAFDSATEARLASLTYGRVLERILPQLPNRYGALDIGTGDGAFLRELVRRGFTDVGGIEPSAAPIAQAAPDVRPLIHHGVFSAEARKPGSLALVTCFQTFEHLRDPVSVCADAARMLQPGGALLLVAHNVRALSARVMGERSPIFDVEHMQLFSRASVRTFLQRAGLHDVAVWPLVNRYPTAYWMRLLPLPAGLKAPAIRMLNSTPLGSLVVPLPAGNMAAVGYRSG